MINSILLSVLLMAQSSGLSTISSAKEPDVRPVASSKILYSAYPVETSSSSKFLVDRFSSLESKVQNYEKLSKDEKQKLDIEIRKVVSSALDLDTLGRRAMLAYWDEIAKLSQGQKKLNEYQKVFKELVEENYLEKARSYINKDHQIYLIEEDEKSKFVLIKGHLKKADADVLLEFKMQKNPPAILDIKLDDTSLEGTYRSSFNRIIRGKDKLEDGFQELMRVMNARLDELKKDGATRL